MLPTLYVYRIALLIFMSGVIKGFCISARALYTSEERPIIIEINERKLEYSKEKFDIREVGPPSLPSNYHGAYQANLKRADKDRSELFFIAAYEPSGAYVEAGIYKEEAAGYQPLTFLGNDVFTKEENDMSVPELTGYISSDYQLHLVTPPNQFLIVNQETNKLAISDEPCMGQFRVYGDELQYNKDGDFAICDQTDSQVFLSGSIPTGSCKSTKEVILRPYGSDMLGGSIPSFP